MLVRSMHRHCTIIPISLIASLRRRDCPTSFNFLFQHDRRVILSCEKSSTSFSPHFGASSHLFNTICTSYLSHTSSTLIPRIRISCDATNQLMCQGIAQYDRNTFPHDLLLCAYRVRFDAISSYGQQSKSN